MLVPYLVSVPQPVAQHSQCLHLPQQPPHVSALRVRETCFPLPIAAGSVADVGDEAQTGLSRVPTAGRSRAEWRVLERTEVCDTGSAKVAAESCSVLFCSSVDETVTQSPRQKECARGVHRRQTALTMSRSGTKKRDGVRRSV